MHGGASVHWPHTDHLALSGYHGPFAGLPQHSAYLHRMSPAIFDHRQILRAFGRAAPHYRQRAVLQREVESRLMEHLDYVTTPPGRILDVGSGPGSASLALKNRWPKAQVIALDLSAPMLREAARAAGRWRPKFTPLRADTRALPFAPGSFDLVFSNLTMPWVEDLPGLFSQWRNVLAPGGFLACSSVGTETLEELREAFDNADPGVPHVNAFAPILHVGDALMASGFRDPVLVADRFTLTYPNLTEMMHDLRYSGAVNVAPQRRQTLTGKARMQRMISAYEAYRGPDGLLPANVEVIYAHAFAPEPGQPVRNAGHDMASVPLSRIPIRRRQ